jgi:hypothetical protein
MPMRLISLDTDFLKWNLQFRSVFLEKCITNLKLQNATFSKKISKNTDLNRELKKLYSATLIEKGLIMPYGNRLAYLSRRGVEARRL